MDEKTRTDTKRIAELLNGMVLRVEAVGDGSLDVHAEVLDGTRKCMSPRFILSSADLGVDDHERLATLGVMVGADVMASMMMVLRVSASEDALDLLIKRATELKREALGVSRI